MLWRVCAALKLSSALEQDLYLLTSCLILRLFFNHFILLCVKKVHKFKVIYALLNILIVLRLKN